MSKKCYAQVGEDWCKNNAIPGKLYCKKHSSFEENEEDIRTNALGVVSDMLDKLPVAYWDEIIQRDICQDMDDTLNQMATGEIIDLAEELKEDIKEEEKKEKTKKRKFIKAIADALSEYDVDKETSIRIAEKITKKLIKL